MDEPCIIESRAIGLGRGAAAPISPRIPAKILLTYLWRHRRLPKLDEPRLFNELVQLRKLHDRDPQLPLLSDKVRVKAFVADRIGREWIIPTLWHGRLLPETPTWPLPFVLKSRHGSNQTAFIRTGAEDWPAIRRRARRWQRSAYGTWLDEWAYAHVERGLLIEPFIGTGGVLPIDYKLFVFGGRVEFIQVHLHRETDHSHMIFDRKWRRRSNACCAQDVPRPASLGRMIEAAEALGGDTDFVRVDLYDAQPHPLFGEMTFYPGSGLDRFAPESLDALFGAHWLRARAVRPSW
jgi:hypothetical protein